MNWLTNSDISGPWKGMITYIILTYPEKPQSAKTLPCPQDWALEKRTFDNAVKEFHRCIDRLERIEPLQQKLQNITPATVRDLFNEARRQTYTSFEQRTKSKRRRLHSSARIQNLSSMDQRGRFVDFSQKVQKVMLVSDRQVVLRAIRTLAKGELANLPDGTSIQPLLYNSGLAPPDDDETSLETYFNTMVTLLEWGVRQFPEYATMPDPSLWDSMAMIDGMRGYGVRSIPPLYTPSVTHPNILTPERKPVQDFVDQVDYIPSFLCSESTARGVIATQCQFGWPRISVPVTCLFIDSDKLGNSLSLASNQDIPVVIIRAELEHLNDNVARASELIAAGLDDIVERSRRKNQLRMNRTPRVAPEQGRLFHGQSISLKNEESKGSIAVFLSTAENKLYALTAYHVVPPKGNESQVITPGGLDSLTQLLAALGPSPNHSAISDLLARREDPFGDVEYGHINLNKEGWRSDWALIRIYDGWVAENGKWFEEDTLQELAIGAEKLSQGFTGKNGLVGCCDPEGGQTCYKDGATTGCTVGVIGSHYCLQFRKGTTDLAPEEDDPANIVVSKVLLVQAFPIDDDEEKDFCQRGDSGSGVFVSDPKADGWNWSGLLVSKLNMLRGSFGVIVPQSQVFRSLKEHTGMSWRLAGQVKDDNQE